MRSLGRDWRTALVAGLGTVAAIAASGLAAAAPANATGSQDPYSPSYHHPYRHGAVPTLETNSKMKAWQHANINATGPKTLSYGGGVDGIGVNSGHSKVYLVFYGTQWGTQTRLQRDQQLLRRLRPRGRGRAEHVQGHRHQQRALVGGPDPVVRRAERGHRRHQLSRRTPTSCPTRPAACSPASGTTTRRRRPRPRPRHQLGQEAVDAAAHFGNTTAASNRNAYYVILSPHGTNPDNYQGSYCAWHDWNGERSAVRRRRTATSPSATSRTTWTRAPAAASASSTPAAPGPWTAGR